MKALGCLMVLFSAFCLSSSELLDLSYDYEEGFTLNWLTTQPFSLVPEKDGYTKDGYWYASNRMCLGEHSGTHLDAPRHFSEKGYAVDEIPLENLKGPGVVIDVREKVQKNSDYELTTDDLMQWLDQYGPLPNNCIVFLRTGWGSRYGNVKEFFGGTDVKNLSFPGISTGASQILTGYEKATGSKVVGVGIDTASLDRGKSTYPGTHIELFNHNIYGLEHVANLEKMPITGAYVMMFPMKIKGGSGAPCRIIAEVNANSSPISLPFSFNKYLCLQIVVFLFLKLLYC